MLARDRRCAVMPRGPPEKTLVTRQASAHFGHPTDTGGHLSHAQSLTSTSPDLCVPRTTLGPPSRCSTCLRGSCRRCGGRLATGAGSRLGIFRVSCSSVRMKSLAAVRGSLVGVFSGRRQGAAVGRSQGLGPALARKGGRKGGKVRTLAIVGGFRLHILVIAHLSDFYM